MAEVEAWPAEVVEIVGRLADTKKAESSEYCPSGRILTPLHQVVWFSATGLWLKARLSGLTEQRVMDS